MKVFYFKRASVFLIIIAGCLASHFSHAGFSENVRKPVVAGTFYPSDAQELSDMIAALTEKATQTPFSHQPDRPLRALIMPHAGYIYSGWTAAHAALALKNMRFSKVVIMAPDHRVGFVQGAISDAAFYRTPLGRIPIHEQAVALRNGFACFRAVPESDAKEHAVEAILPFLQKYLNAFSIIPIVLGPGEPETYANAIRTVMDRDTLLVVSTDLSHYLPYDRAVSMDQQTINLIMGLHGRQLAENKRRACGMTPLLVLMELANASRWRPELIHYANSGDTAGGRDKVVGYTTIAFYGEKEMTDEKETQQFSREKGEVLLALARKTIAEKLGMAESETKGADGGFQDPDLQSRRGTFVTLKINDQLRGCIGNLAPDKPLAEGIRSNAINAAFNDPRFPPLSQTEFDKIQIEVSLLTEPQPLEYRDAQDLLNQLRPGVDGLIIRKGARSATFLPQVWEQLPDRKSFLEHLCMKAGLPPGEWKKSDLQVFTYQVQYFEEEH